MQTHNCLFTMAVAVVVTIIAISLLILVRDIVRFAFKKTSLRSSSGQSLPRPEGRDQS